MLKENIFRIRAGIEAAARRSGRDPGGIRLICVTKGRAIEEVRKAIGCGITDIGENKVQETTLKFKTLIPYPLPLTPLRWHMIGHLQTNKIKDAVRVFDMIHSVDSLRLAREMDKEAKKQNKVQDILIEVKTSEEATKFGVNPADLMGLVRAIIDFKHIRLKGLMTMAPLVNNKEEARPYFQKLRRLQETLNSFLTVVSQGPANVLSMGMSQDYEVAIEEGSTMVRIGTAIFGNKI